MKSRLLVSSLLVFGMGMTLNANASEIDCFPMCAAPATIELKVDVPSEGGPGEGTSKSCDAGSANGAEVVKQVEALNNKVKPIRDIVGYVRSPQGLAIKLVNDNIVKIPAWIGFAMDPLGSLKRIAIDEVRTRAKEVIVGNSGSACENAPLFAPLEATPAIDAITSI